jgi:hypothetical protein
MVQIVKPAAWAVSAHRRRSKHVSRQPDPGTHREESNGEKKHNQRRKKGGTKELHVEPILRAFWSLLIPVWV